MDEEPPHGGDEALALAQRILDVHDKMQRELNAGRYESAAGLRDQRELLQDQLKSIGSETLVRSARLALRPQFPGRYPMLEMLDEPREPALDQTLLAMLPAPTPPVRWLVYGYETPPTGTVRQLFKVGSLESRYYRAKLLEISFRTFGHGFSPDEWLRAAVWEAEHAEAETIWLVADIPWLERRDLFEPLLQILGPDKQFIAFAASDRIVGSKGSGSDPLPFQTVS